MKIPTQKIQICVGIFLQHYTFLQKRTFSILYENFSRFVRKATTVGFKSLRFLCVTKKQKTPQLWCLLFFGPPEVLFAFFLLSTSPTAACSQSNFHQRSSLKTVHRTVFFTVGFKSLRFLCVTKKQKTPQLWCLLFFWPTRRDLNPHSPESESVALSNCATDGYKPHFSYGCFLLSNTINQRVLPKLRTALPARFGDPQAFW